MENFQIHGKIQDLENKSKNSLLKENEINNISFLNITENKNKIDSDKKSKNSIFKMKRKSNLINVENSKIEQHLPVVSKHNLRITQEQSKENGTNFDIINSRYLSGNGANFRDYNDKISLNMLDYCCCHLSRNKRGNNIQLYNRANSFYRKKFDVVNVFNLLLLIEKIFIRNNLEYIYSLNEDLDYSGQKK